MIIVHPSLEGCVDTALLLTENPSLAFTKILTFFAVPPYVGPGGESGAHVHPEATVGDNVTLAGRGGLQIVWTATSRSPVYPPCHAVRGLKRP